VTWRSRARPIIAEVLRKHAGSDEKVRRKALRDAYPFGPRQFWPYKVWLDEIGRQRGTRKPDKRSGVTGQRARSDEELRERIREIEEHNRIHPIECDLDEDCSCEGERNADDDAM